MGRRLLMESERFIQIVKGERGDGFLVRADETHLGYSLGFPWSCFLLVVYLFLSPWSSLVRPDVNLSRRYLSPSLKRRSLILTKKKKKSRKNLVGNPSISPLRLTKLVPLVLRCPRYNSFFFHSLILTGSPTNDSRSLATYQGIRDPLPEFLRFRPAIPNTPDHGTFIRVYR